MVTVDRSECATKRTSLYRCCSCAHVLTCTGVSTTTQLNPPNTVIPQHYPKPTNYTYKLNLPRLDSDVCHLRRRIHVSPTNYTYKLNLPNAVLPKHSPKPKK